MLEFFKSIGRAILSYAIDKPIQFAFRAATVITGVKGFLQAKEMLAKGQDIMANKTAAGGKIPVIYGTRRVGAQIVYMDTAQNRSKDLFVVYAISVGECEEILGRTIEIDGNSILDGNIYKGGGYVGSDKISSGSGSLNTASQVGDNQYSNAGTLGTDPTLRYSFVFNLHHGASSQTADPMLRASIPTEWTTNHKLNGICYIAASFDYDKKGMYKGVPQITVQVKGKKVYDPRTDTTAWSSNPALCFLDYIQNDLYGKGLATSQINMTTISSAANKCDTLVDQPYYNGNYQNVTWSGTSGDDFIIIDDNADWWQNKVDEVIDIRDSSDTVIFDGVDIKGTTRYEFYDATQENRLYIDGTLSSSYTDEAGSARAKVKRFHCNGYIDTNKNVMDNAKELLANMRGILNYVNGKYELEIEDTGTSTFSITDDHIIADTGISVDYGNKDKKANKVVIEFFNANKKYELDTATVLHDASPEYYSDDGEVLEIKAEFPYVTDPYIAYNMGKAILTRSRNQTTMQFLGTPEMYKLNVGDIVDLTYSGLGFSGKVCRVEALELQANGLVSVSLIEYFDVYTWEVPAQESTEILAKIPTIGALKPPQASSIVFTDTDASAINRPTLTWTEPTDFPVRQYRVDVVDSSDNNVFSKIVDTPSVDLAFLPKAADYEASITSFNGVGIESNASTKTFTIADDPVKTTEVEMNGVTLSTVETYGTVSGKTGNWVKFLNKTNFAEIVEFDNGLIVDSGTAQFENSATFADGFTGQGIFDVGQGAIEFSSYTPATTTDRLYNVSGSLYWNGQALGTGTGDITAVVAGTNLNGGGTSGSVTLNLDSTITGDHTFSDNVIISGDLTVNGTTTTVNTNDLNVKDKNITLNYSTGDSSASANGAGITIQDAVSATEDATLTWNNTNDSFNFSHPLNVTGTVTADGFQTDTTNTNYNLLARNSFNASTYIQNGGPGDILHVRSGSMSAGQGDLHFKVSNNGDISFYDDTGSSQALFWDASAESLGIGTTSPNAKLELNVASGDGLLIKSADVSTIKMKGSGSVTDWGFAATYLAAGDFGIYASNSAGGDPITAGTAKMYFKSNGKVGIGTTSPSGELHVSNAADFYVDVDGTDSAVVFKEGGGNSWRIGNRASGDKFNITQDASSLGTNVRFTIDNGGKVGIGTTSPNFKLHLKDGTSTAVYQQFSNDTTGNTTSDGTVLGIDADGDFLINNLESKTIKLYTADTERIRLDSAGQLGIGTTSPSALLHVKSTGNGEIEVERASGALINLQAQSARGVIGTDSNHELQLKTNSTARVTITTSGRVGINETSPQHDLHISDTSDTRIWLEATSGDTGELYAGTGVSLFNRSNSYLTFGTNNTERIRLDSSGNLIVGGTTAQQTSAVTLTQGGSIINDGFIRPATDASYDIGSSSKRYQDLYLSGTANVGNIASGQITITQTHPTLYLQTSGGGATDAAYLQKYNNDLYLYNKESAGSLFLGTNNATKATIDSSGNVGIGTTVTNALGWGSIAQIGGANPAISLKNSSNVQWDISNFGGTFNIYNGSNPRLKIDSSGNVGINTTSPADKLHVEGNLYFGTSTRTIYTGGSGNLHLQTNTGEILFLRSNGSSEVMRIDDNNRVGIGTTSPSEKLHVVGNAEISGNIETSTFLSTGNATVEGTLTSEGLFTTDNKAQIEGSKSSSTNPIATIKNKNSTNTNGTYLDFVDHNDNFVCSIGTRPQDNTSNSFIIGGSGSYKTGLKFLNYTTYQAIYPATADGATTDNTIDLGYSSGRFQDIYATNGTIQTSDKNEKQDIQALTEAEQRVATACKGLIRRFRWQDAVEKKDNNPDSDLTARYHFGVMAQDLQDAFTAEGLDAGDYGMFISSTWTDDDGNEQTRLGVRYNELLAFIIATL
jgi:hypothetical protein